MELVFPVTKIRTRGRLEGLDVVDGRIVDLRSDEESRGFSREKGSIISTKFCIDDSDELSLHLESGVTLRRPRIRISN
jgi:hypothetical protein